jgi:hypothetical protein
VPAQQRRRRDQEDRPPLPRQQLRQGGQQHPIRVPVSRAAHLPAQDRELMPQHRDLNLVGIRRRTPPEHAKNPSHDHQRHRTDHHDFQPAGQHRPRLEPSS